MEEKNRLNTVRTDRIMTHLETEIAAMNLHSVETSMKMKREPTIDIFDYILGLGPAVILVVVLVAALLFG